MITNEKKVAAYLLQSKAIILKPANPFLWSSGWHAPIYCDNRITLSYPEIRTFIRDAFVEVIQSQFSSAQLVAGVATGAIAQGVLVAEKMGIPFAYVRSAPKGHGLENLIEGKVEKGQKVIVIEDLISTGGSSLKAVDALRNEGCEVIGMCAIFTYQFKVAMDNFAKSNCKLAVLSNYSVLLDLALETGYIRKEHLEILKRWRENPETWKP